MLEYLNSDFQNCKGLKGKEVIKIVQIPIFLIVSKVFDKWKKIKSPGTSAPLVMRTARCENPFDKVNGY